ncbi:hypothetical protein EJ110_NYTH48671 [Nymphaea thermarum]|nr:hypothetical protein EJ110_NYTH48671 [Nymphaea thermarum]
MQDPDVGYGDPHEEEGSEGEDVELKEEDVGVSLGTAKGKGIMHRGGSSSTATSKRRGVSTSAVLRGRDRIHGRIIGTGGGRVPTMTSSIGQIEATSMRKHHTQYDPISLDHFDVLDSWVEEEPSAILEEDDLDFLNIEGATKIIEEEEAGE